MSSVLLTPKPANFKCFNVLKKLTKLLIIICFPVIIDNPLVTNKDPEKGDKFCPTTPR